MSLALLAAGVLPAHGDGNASVSYRNGEAKGRLSATVRRGGR
jgi:hypothetical protein